MARPTKEQQEAKKAAEQAAQQQPILKELNEIKELLKQATQAPAFSVTEVMKMQARDFITIEEAAFLYGIDIKVVRDMVRSYRVIPYRGKDNRIYVRKTDFRYSMTGEALACDEAARLTFDE